MKRTRAELKSQAKAALRRNYWKAVLVSLLVLLLAGGGAAGSGASTALNGSDDEYYDEYYYSDEYDDYDYATTAYQPAVYDVEPSASLSESSLVEDILGLFSLTLPALSVGVVIIICIVLLILAVIAILLDVFVFAPLRVGARRFFLVCQQDKARLGELTWAFDQNYRHTVKTMFFRDVKLLLWTLLFIIPGIVKSYEYAAVPYLLAECPEMDSREIFAASRDLMDGNKGRAFVLELSFMLWNIASVCTLGLLGVFFVNPYQNLTEAAFYQAVCQEKAAQYPPQWEGGYLDGGAE